MSQCEWQLHRQIAVIHSAIQRVVFKDNNTKTTTRVVIVVLR